MDLCYSVLKEAEGDISTALKFIELSKGDRSQNVARTAKVETAFEAVLKSTCKSIMCTAGLPIGAHSLLFIAVF